MNRKTVEGPAGRSMLIRYAAVDSLLETMMIKIVGVVLMCAGLIVLGYIATSWGNQWTLTRSALVVAGLVLFGSGASSFLFRANVRR